MYVFIFSTNFIENISYSKKNLARYCHKCENVFMWSTRYYCWIWMKLDFPWQVFENVLNIKFNQNSSSGHRVVLREQKGGHYEANSRSSQFCERS
jgi:hypothetical protein